MRAGGFSLLIGIGIVGAPLPFIRWPYAGFEAVVAGVAAALAFLWFAFVGWRAWRLVLAGAARDDRDYDRTGKYQLPPEYAATQSATRTARRRRKHKAP